MKYRRYRITDMDRRRLGRLVLSGSARTMAALGVMGELECQLEECEAMLSELIPDDVVTMNSTVHLVSETSGAKLICTVVYPEDVDLIDHGVSVLDVLGSSLVGCEVGDLIEWETQKDRGPWRIAEIAFQPERVGQFHL